MKLGVFSNETFMPLRGTKEDENQSYFQMKKMKLALVNTINPQPHKWDLQTTAPPLGLLSLMVYLKEKFPEKLQIKIVETLSELLDFGPDLVGFSSVTENFSIAENLAKEVKSRLSIPIFIGGVHISLLPQTLPEVFDFAVIGEGEETLLELINLLWKEGKFTYNKLKNIQGLCIRDKDKLILTPPRPFIKNLDTLPHIPRTQIDRSGIIHMVTSRGCCYKCSFCSTTNFWKTHRIHSANYVAEDLRHIMHNINPPHIKFFDDLFIINRNRIAKLSKIIKEEGLAPEGGYSCFVRANLLDEEMVKHLAEMNFLAVSFGVESASPAILAKLKPSSSLELSQRAIDLLYKYGIKISCSFILGTPGETEEDLEATFNFIVKNEEKILEIEVCPLVPLPGTEIWEYALLKGLVKIPMDWSLLTDYSIFTHFSPDRYIYLNPSMPWNTFLSYCKRFGELYLHFNKKSRYIFSNIFYKIFYPVINNKTKKEEK